jgi:Calcineurin-like phosphoesterase
MLVRTRIRRILTLRCVEGLSFLLLAAGIVGSARSQVPQTPPAANEAAKFGQSPMPANRPPDNYILVGAGDIASCKALEGAEATAKLIEQIPGTVFAAGDLAYEHGSAAEFKNCYGTTWGRFKDRTRPALGNHEYADPSAAAYFQYWGDQAGPAGKGYYSYDLGIWHIIVLNTNCDAPGLGGCAKGSPEELWLRQDLSEHPNACIVSYGHHALFSSGVFRKHALHPELTQFWQDLYAAHADLMLVGHEHSYERFAPQDPEGHLDFTHGIRQIVAGTGGRSHDLLGFAIANSEVRNYDTYGVLKVTLMPHAYTWEFIPEPDHTFRDSGSGVCHNQTAQEANASADHK